MMNMNILSVLSPKEITAKENVVASLTFAATIVDIIGVDPEKLSWDEILKKLDKHKYTLIIDFLCQAPANIVSGDLKKVLEKVRLVCFAIKMGVLVKNTVWPFLLFILSYLFPSLSEREEEEEKKENGKEPVKSKEHCESKGDSESTEAENSDENEDKEVKMTVEINIAPQV